MGADFALHLLIHTVALEELARNVVGESKGGNVWIKVGSGPLLIFLPVCVTSQKTYRTWTQKDEGNKDWRWFSEGQ